VRYDDTGIGQPDFTYSYGEAVADGVCRKIVFVPFDGELSWSSDGTVIDATFTDELDARQAAYRHRTAVSSAASHGLRRMLVDADGQLTWVRDAGRHPDAGGLVVACDIAHAQRIADLLRAITGESVTVVTSDDSDAAIRLERFRHGSQRWIVAVNMVSEGVDIPRLRVGVYATVAKTPLLFRQIVGRFVRVTAGKPSDASFLLIPADPVLRALADEIEKELRHDLTTAPDEHQADVSDLDADPASSSFVALDARVAPQGALLSGLLCANPQQAAAIDELSRTLGLDAEEVYRRVIGGDEPILPPLPDETDFVRRERLRKERRRLVGRLHHATARDYAELQTWVNDAVAAGRPVDQHTIAELERGIRLLVRALEKGRSSPGAEAA
jgi:superfamily II DNA or RNA helicase